MTSMPSFVFDREDTYMYFAKDCLPDRPTIVEVGSIHGAHGTKLRRRFNDNITMITYEAGKENYESLCRDMAPVPVQPSGGCNPPHVLNHRAAVTGCDGEVEFFEFQEISSNSIYPRHSNEGRHLRRASFVRSVSLETIMRENMCSCIDLLFLNCEGAELGILEEVLTKPLLRNRVGQICVSFHGGRVYPKEKTDAMVEKMSDFFWVVEEKNDWPCHLFVNKNFISTEGGNHGSS